MPHRILRRRIGLFLTVVAWTVGASSPPVLAQREAPKLTGRITTFLEPCRFELTGTSRVLRVRPAGIACPSDSSPWGDRTRDAMRLLVGDETVTVEVEEIRLDGDVKGWIRTASDHDLSRELLRLGLAWVQEDGPDERRLAALQSDARRARRGVWGDPDGPRPGDAGHPKRERPAIVIDGTGDPDRPPRSTVPRTSRGCRPRSECCKVCSKGKACGASCISRSYTCRKGRGCACNAHEICR